MPVVHLSGEPPCDPNQSSALPIIDYNGLTPGKTKETHPMHIYIVAEIRLHYTVNKMMQSEIETRKFE